MRLHSHGDIRPFIPELVEIGLVCLTPWDQAWKIFELAGRCRATFSPHFTFRDFAWLNLLAGT